MIKNQSDNEKIVESVVRSVFSVSPDSVTPILDKGRNNSVFKIVINNENKILRLQNSAEQLSLYEKEKWCAEAASETGVLTPKILEVGFHNGWSYSFQEYVESISSESADIEKIWKTLGEYAEKIHQIDAIQIQIDYKKDLDNYEKLFSAHVDTIFPSDLCSKINKRLREAEKWDFAPKLCHGNLHPSNVVTDVSGQVWLIDWETATGNYAPYADLAEIFTWNNGKQNIDLFRQGYGFSDSDLISMMRDIQTLVLFRLLQVIQRKVNRSSSDEWRQDKFVTEMILLFSLIEDFDQDVLFTKNM